MPIRVEHIEQHVAKLEKQLRRQRLITVGFGVAVLGAATLGMAAANTPEELTVKSLTVLQANGTPGFVVGAGPTGFGMAIMDSSFKPRIAMGLNPENEAGIAVMDTNGFPRIALGTDSAKGEAGIVLIDAGTVTMTAAEAIAEEAKKKSRK